MTERAISRRAAIALAAAAALSARSARAEDKVLRIGVQKYGTLVILRERKTLDAALKPLGWTATWTEFPGGPQLLEALRVGAIDFGTAGEAPPIFAQAAGAPMVYVGVEPPSPRGEAILAAKDSPIRTVADLRGRKVALNKGSNVHYLLVAALAKAGVAWGDITPVYLAPSDGRAAFQAGKVDAWVIWDPYLAAAQASLDPRVLTDGTDTAPNRQYFLATRALQDGHPDVLAKVLAELDGCDEWARTHQTEAVSLLAAGLGLPEPVVGAALGRMGYGVKPLAPDVVEGQQKIADAFLELGLIPEHVTISAAVGAPRT
jgi:sulfonate transport system substrate-binding protein